MRNRLLFAERHDPPVLGIPKTQEEVRNHAGLKRGPYHKTNAVVPLTDEAAFPETDTVSSDVHPKGGTENV